VRPQALPETCGGCHDDSAFVAKFQMGFKEPCADFVASVHGKVLSGETGDRHPPTCSTCHGVHDIRNRVQPGSHISSFEVPNTCGQCHEKETETYKRSVHWMLARRGVTEAPVCNDCHGEHGVAEVAGESEAARRQRQDLTCVHCHSDPAFATRFGLDAGRADRYLDSYHGLASSRGDERAALCIDCHSAHAVLPKSHPASTVHADNVQQTCATCHDDASAVFALSYSHEPGEQAASAVPEWVRRIYVWLIIVVIGGMLLHNMVIMLHELRHHLRHQKDETLVPRFSRRQVLQHQLLVISFTVLVITGFALKFPEAIPFCWLTDLGLNEPLRRTIHRGAGVLMLLVGIWHLVHIAVTRPGRSLIVALLPRIRDIRETVDNVLYHLLPGRERPHFRSFCYIEKSEYWALMWGSVIMAVTGFFLWFPTLVSDWAPVWLIQVCEVVHYYEAILATLAIVVWHLFFVICHPREYPMNFTWLHGQIPLDIIRREYRGEYKAFLRDWALVAAGARTEDELAYSSRQFFAALRRDRVDIDALFQADLAADRELREWLAAEDVVPPPAGAKE
jgi:cytochrome b subunit of formate dehydrogenase